MDDFGKENGVTARPPPPTPTGADKKKCSAYQEMNEDVASRVPKNQEFPQVRSCVRLTREQDWDFHKHLGLTEAEASSSNPLDSTHFQLQKPICGYSETSKTKRRMNRRRSHWEGSKNGAGFVKTSLN